LSDDSGHDFNGHFNGQLQLQASKGGRQPSGRHDNLTNITKSNIKINNY
jgi:hypothetical protein